MVRSLLPGSPIPYGTFDTARDASVVRDPSRMAKRTASGSIEKGMATTAEEETCRKRGVQASVYQCWRVQEQTSRVQKCPIWACSEVVRGAC